MISLIVLYLAIITVAMFILDDVAELIFYYFTR